MRPSSMCRLASLAILLLGASVGAQVPLGTAFTYQGEIAFEGVPLNDTADFEFTLWDAAELGTAADSMVSLYEVTVADGRFTALLDFGCEVFNGEARWLEIAVRSPAGGGDYTILSPRQPLTATPYALQTRGMFCSEDGNIGIGTTTPQHPLTIGEVADGHQVSLRTFGTGDYWKGGAAFGYNTASVIMGEYGGGATIGATGPNLLEWRNLAINPEGSVTMCAHPSTDASVGIGTYPREAYMMTVESRPSGNLNLLGYEANDHGGRISFSSYADICESNGELYLFALGPGYSLFSGNSYGSAFSIHDGLLTAQAGMYVDEYHQGIVWADWKFFRADNPDDPGTEIWYGCLEGPEQAAYVRGTGHLVGGEAVIEFPDHFRAVAKAEGMTVQVTPLSADSKGLAVVHKDLQQVRVRELGRGTGTYDFDYMVTAPRKGSERFDVVRPRSENPARPGAAAGAPSRPRSR